MEFLYRVTEVFWNEVVVMFAQFCEHAKMADLYSLTGESYGM